MNQIQRTSEPKGTNTRRSQSVERAVSLSLLTASAILGIIGRNRRMTNRKEEPLTIKEAASVKRPRFGLVPSAFRAESDKLSNADTEKRRIRRIKQSQKTNHQNCFLPLRPLKSKDLRQPSK